LVENRIKEEGRKRTLYLRNVHFYWYLAIPLYIEDTYLRIKDPKIAVPKGRPKNHPAPPSTMGLAIPEATEIETPRRRSTPKTPS
jgi:hypothetical protein